MSALKEGITTTILHDNMETMKNGLFDDRLGTIDESLNCRTCKLNMHYCPGHTTFIDLDQCIFNVAFI